MKYKVALPRDEIAPAVTLHMLGTITHEDQDIELSEAQATSLRRKGYRVRVVKARPMPEPESEPVVVEVGGGAEGAEGVSDGAQDQQ